MPEDKKTVSWLFSTTGLARTDASAESKAWHLHSETDLALGSGHRCANRRLKPSCNISRSCGPCILSATSATTSLMMSFLLCLCRVCKGFRGRPFFLASLGASASAAFLLAGVTGGASGCRLSFWLSTATVTGGASGCRLSCPLLAATPRSTTRKRPRSAAGNGVHPCSMTTNGPE